MLVINDFEDIKISINQMVEKEKIFRDLRPLENSIEQFRKTKNIQELNKKFKEKQLQNIRVKEKEQLDQRFQAIVRRQFNEAMFLDLQFKIEKLLQK